MKILLNGDSNMSGEELEDCSLSMGSQLCQILGGEEINLALSGASNDRIYNTTLEYINKNPAPNLIVIGWTEMCRVQWFLTNQDASFAQTNQTPGFVEINSLGIGSKEYPSEYDNRLKHWFTVANNTDYRDALSFYWHERIYNLHKLLEFQKIPHIFFHAFHNFKIHDQMNQLNWSNRFMEPYTWCFTNEIVNLSYIHWCECNDYKQITPGWFHYEPAAQRAWAERLAIHIQKHNLMTYDL